MRDKSRFQQACAPPIGVKVIISEKISPCPKGIKMTDEAVTSGNANILQPLVSAIKTTEPLTAFLQYGNWSGEDILFTQTFNCFCKELKVLLKLYRLSELNVICTYMNNNSTDSGMTV